MQRSNVRTLIIKIKKATNMIKTKSIYKPVEEEDGLRILITRFYPRGVKREKYDIWVRELAPSAELLKRYKNKEIDWDNFKTTLLNELRDNLESVEVIQTLHSQSQFGDVTLLCYEKDGCPCHRHLVRDLMEDPRLLQSNFVSENTDNHKIIPVQIHVSHEKALVVP